MAPSSESGCTWERSSCAPRLAFTSPGTGGRSAKVLRIPMIRLSLAPPSSCILGSTTERASGGTLIACNGFSVSYQVGEIGVYQIYTGSNLVPVLCLRPLSKYSRVYQVYISPAECLHMFVVGRDLRESSGLNQPSFYQAHTDQDLGI